MNARMRVVVLGLLSLSFASVMQFQGARATENETTTCSTVLSQQYLSVLTLYEGSPRKDGKSYRTLVEAFKSASRERKACMRMINDQFKSDLQAIKLRYEQSKGTSNLRREVRETQRRAEISAASIKRDEALRNLPSIPEPPARPIRSN